MKHVIVLLGGVSVGKSVLFRAFQGDPFCATYMTTVSLDVCHVSWKRLDDVSVVLQVWDTPGHKHFQACIDLVLKKAKCICLVFDTSKKESFQYCMDMHKQLDKNHECLLIVNDYKKLWLQWSTTVSKQPMPFVVIQELQEVQKTMEYLANNLNHDSKVIFDKIIQSTSSNCF